MKKFCCLFLGCLFANVALNTSELSAKEILYKEFPERKNPFLATKKCEEIQSIDGVDFCIQKSTITLNSCGPTTDWPCMDEAGCLEINKFIESPK
jgi:hypothetical protein|tara:strand:+ start:1223 stop:1507 length:285 start_codon:yes stop_codon:yes gene_type:complete